MGLLEDLKSQWRIMPGRVTSLTASVQTAPGVFGTTATIREAWWRHVGRREAESSSGGYLVEEIDWFYPEELNTAVLSPGDTFTYNSLVHIVSPEGTKRVGAQGAWKCNTLRPHLNTALSDTIQVRRYASATNDAGYMIQGSTYTTIATGFPCKIQETDTFGLVAVGTSETLGKMQSPILANIFLSSVLRIQPHDVIIDQNGLKYTFEADANVNRIGQFMSIQSKRLL